METLTAWSTFALAIFTLFLFIMAAWNFKKFIENVNLMSQSVEKQTEAIDLQSKDILLNYKPVVFIKEVLPPLNSSDALNPLKHIFVLTNSGKLPARDVQMSATMNIASGTNSVQDHIVTILDKASIYPNSDLTFQAPIPFQFGDKVDKAELRFTISYRGDGLTQQLRENMKYIFTDSSNRRWRHIGPQEDIFFKEKFDRKKAQYQNIADLTISEGRLMITREIVGGIVGIDKVLASNPDELIRSFAAISEEINEMKHFHTQGLNAGALAGLRSGGVIDLDSQLTLVGVSVFKCVAEIMKAEETESER